MGGPGPPQQLAGLPRPDFAGQVIVMGFDHGVYFSSVSALSESISKSACAFPTMSSAVRVLASSASRRSFLWRNRSTSRWSALRLLLGLPARPAREPASRALRHSVIWEL